MFHPTGSREPWEIRFLAKFNPHMSAMGEGISIIVSQLIVIRYWAYEVEVSGTPRLRFLVVRRPQVAGLR